MLTENKQNSILNLSNGETQTYTNNKRYIIQRLYIFKVKS